MQQQIPEVNRKHEMMNFKKCLHVLNDADARCYDGAKEKRENRQLSTRANAGALQNMSTAL